MALFKWPGLSYHSLMINQESYMTPYAEYILQKGYTLRECYRPSQSALKREVPDNMKDRYATYEEYENAIHEFLNGN